jgi:hypothetical protein
MSAKRVLLGAVAVAAISATGTRADQIAIDFFGGGGSAASSLMALTETAGVLPQANWNSFSGNVQATPQALVNSAGAATTATVVWTSNNTWNTPTPPNGDPGDLKMMKGYLDSSDTSVTSVTVTGLPAAIAGGPYSVILYYDGDNGGNNRVGQYSISGAATGNATFWALDAANATFNGLYTQAQSPIDPLVIPGGAIDSNNAAAITVPAGNFMIFTGLTGSGFTLNAQSSVASDTTNRSAVQGIQIVSGNVPEPAGLTVLALGAAALVGRV